MGGGVGLWEGLELGGRGDTAQVPVSYVLHPGVSLHNVFFHLVCIFLQSLYEFGEFLVGDAVGREEWEVGHYRIVKGKNHLL